MVAVAQPASLAASARAFALHSNGTVVTWGHAPLGKPDVPDVSSWARNMGTGGGVLGMDPTRRAVYPKRRTYLKGHGDSSWPVDGTFFGGD